MEPHRFLRPIYVIVVLALVATLGGAWFWTLGPCGTRRVATTADQMELYLQRYLDALRLGAGTNSDALEGPLQFLQLLREDYSDNINVPTCMATAHGHVLDTMDIGTAALARYAQVGPDEGTEALFDEADREFGLAVKAILAVEACAPFCGESTFVDS